MISVILLTRLTGLTELGTSTQVLCNEDLESQLSYGASILSNGSSPVRSNAYQPHLDSARVAKT